MKFINSGLWVGLLILAFAIIVQSLKFKEGFVPTSDQQCGIDMPPCPFGSACINGYCGSMETPKLPESSGLPVVP